VPVVAVVVRIFVTFVLKTFVAFVAKRG